MYCRRKKQLFLVYNPSELIIAENIDSLWPYKRYEYVLRRECLRGVQCTVYTHTRLDGVHAGG